MTLLFPLEKSLNDQTPTNTQLCRTFGREVFNPLEHVMELATAMRHLSQDLVKLDCSQTLRDFC